MSLATIAAAAFADSTIPKCPAELHQHGAAAATYRLTTTGARSSCAPCCCRTHAGDGSRAWRARVPGQRHLAALGDTGKRFGAAVGERTAPVTAKLQVRLRLKLLEQHTSGLRLITLQARCAADSQHHSALQAAGCQAAAAARVAAAAVAAAADVAGAWLAAAWTWLVAAWTQLARLAQHAYCSARQRLTAGGGSGGGASNASR